MQHGQKEVKLSLNWILKYIYVYAYIYTYYKWEEIPFKL